MLVIHDWGATLGFDWAAQHPDRVQGIAYMEAAPLPLTWDDFPDEQARNAFRAFRSDAGEDMVLRDNLFLESFLIGAEPTCRRRTRWSTAVPSSDPARTAGQC